MLLLRIGLGRHFPMINPLAKINVCLIVNTMEGKMRAEFESMTASDQARLPKHIPHVALYNTKVFLFCHIAQNLTCV